MQIANAYQHGSGWRSHGLEGCVEVMRWCLRDKLARHWDRFGDLLISTAAFPIVEESTRDDFWGARPRDDWWLHGRNVLGCLLMELRDLLEGSHREALRVVEPPALPDFRLPDQPIGRVGRSAKPGEDEWRRAPSTAVFR